MRYTGKPVYSVCGLKVLHDGASTPLHTTSGNRFSGGRSELQRQTLELQTRRKIWFAPNSPWPTRKRPAAIRSKIKSSKLSEDGKTLTLEIADLKPVMQQSLKFNLKAADGTPIAQEIQHTIHAIP